MVSGGWVIILIIFVTVIAKGEGRMGRLSRF